MRKVDVLIYSSYSGGCGTPKMSKITSKGDEPVVWRTGEVVEYVNSRAVSNVDDNNVAKFLKADPENILLDSVFEDIKRYMYYDKEFKKFLTFSIVSVDVDRPWTIKDNGAEEVVYLDEAKKVNEELNYWE